MQLSFVRYPVFQANQVLTSGHLNDVFDYLDEQTRLTRANLIGIGIVCGLDIKLDNSAGSTILLSKGCGVTSKGYLVLEHRDLALVSYRDYKLPTEVDYPEFKQDNGPGQDKTPYKMWELFEKDEPNATSLATPAGFLDDKAVVLFLELNQQGLRNCSPNNCDDKGAEITVTVRRLLVSIADLDKIIIAANQLDTGLTSSDLANALSAELNLPDLPVPRFDVLNSSPSGSDDVYAAFLNVFRTPKLVTATGEALSAAYSAFKPLLQNSYPADPFTGFENLFGFLDTAPTTVTQVRFLQYYVDLFEDLLHAYDEFRWKGVDLICACCPPDGLFPRHLMLGLLDPEKAAQPSQYRETFRPSPAVGNCAADSKSLVQLFARLVEMALRFTNTPSLPPANNQATIDPQIRVTPSLLGDIVLAKKAIPYYYRQNGTPPLYQLWNREKTVRNRGNQNLSYRYDEYTPAAPAFVSAPLRYDLERYNFLRIEGHLGKSYQRVLSSLLQLKSQYRLPIDIIALRTGDYDDKQKLDVTQYAAQFQDLETLYDTLREEALCSLAEAALGFYDVLLPNSELAGGTPKHPLLKKYAPYYRYPGKSVGALYEEHLAALQALAYIDIDQAVSADPTKFAAVVQKITERVFKAIGEAPTADDRGPVVTTFYLTKLSDLFTSTLDAVVYPNLANRYEDLLALVRFFRDEIASSAPRDLKSFVPQAELMDQFDEILFNRKLEAIKAVSDEYARRVGDLKKMLFLSSFLLKHPGIQHKSGVPMGGTFILVYHGEPVSGLSTSQDVILNAGAIAEVASAKLSGNLGKNANAAVTDKAANLLDTLKTTDINQLALTDAVDRISSDQALLKNADVNFLIRSLKGQIPLTAKKPGAGQESPAAKIIAAAVNGLDNGTVIADFYLPYQISAAPGIQFVLPKIPPSFSTKVACTDGQGNASVGVTVKGGTPPYDVAIDGGSYSPLNKTVVLSIGTHTLKVRDAEALESSPQTVVVPAAIAIGAIQYACESGKYTATFPITGGTPPYTVNGKAAAGNSFKTDPVDSGKSLDIEVLDSLKCNFNTTLTHECPPPCDLPCNGLFLRRGYRFWLPEPMGKEDYTGYGVDNVVCSADLVESKPPLDVSKTVAKFIRVTAAELNANFKNVADRLLTGISTVIDENPDTLKAKAFYRLTYESLGADRLGTLWLERYVCLNFTMKMLVSTTRSGRDQVIAISYDSSGTTIQFVNPSGGTVKIPAFNGQQSDLCNPNKPPVDLCAGAKLPELTIKETDRSGRKVFLTVTANPNDPSLQYLWEAPGGDPALGNGIQFATTYPILNAEILTTVTVTAFTNVGCTVTKSIQFKI